MLKLLGCKAGEWKDRCIWDATKNSFQQIVFTIDILVKQPTVGQSGGLKSKICVLQNSSSRKFLGEPFFAKSRAFDLMHILRSRHIQEQSLEGLGLPFFFFPFSSHVICQGPTNVAGGSFIGVYGCPESAGRQWRLIVVSDMHHCHKTLDSWFYTRRKPLLTDKANTVHATTMRDL